MSDLSRISSTVVIQGLLDQMRSGDQDASRNLLNATMERLRSLAKKILADRPGVQRWEGIDDVLQNSAVRLWKALEKNHPATPKDYFRLAAAVIRRELIDLTRHYFGPRGLAANHAKSWGHESDRVASPVDLKSDNTHDPVKLKSWTEFHEYIEGLPDEERLLFDLLWYQSLTLSEAAEVMNSSERTVRRKWRSARLKLFNDLQDDGEAVNLNMPS